MLFIDLRDCGDEASVLDRFEQARRLGTHDFNNGGVRHPLLVDCTGVEITEKVLESVKLLGRKAQGRMGRMGAIGLTGIKRIFLTAYNLSTGQWVRSFDDRDSALDWLTE